VSAAKSLLLAAASAALLALPRVAEACAVCMSGRDDDTQRAFLLGTLLLSGLPFALIGGLALWIRRRARAQAETERAGERTGDGVEMLNYSPRG
jgi:hypothetical protein